MSDQSLRASGLAEKIGESRSRLTHKKMSDNREAHCTEINNKIRDHKQGLSLVIDILVDTSFGVIENKQDIAAIGHRVVHGGEQFTRPVLIDEGVIEAIQKNIPLAPLHNPSNLEGIQVARDIFPAAPQVAVFDTAFHQTIPPRAFLYALPYRLYQQTGIRRYGFHGTSHASVAEAFSAYCNRPLEELNLITIHLGNGSSMAAVQKGRCVDTSMGMTPLEGLVMGTRSGDLDPAISFFLNRHFDMKFRDIEMLFNKESGLKGICGTNDMREIIQRKQAGDESAGIAVDIYCHRIKKYIGAYFAVLERVDGIIFTAGIGENVPEIREMSCSGLTKLGIQIDSQKNVGCRDGICEIHAEKSEVKIMVIPTDEELKIARETENVVKEMQP